jgi:hypothetical protein
MSQAITRVSGGKNNKDLTDKLYSYLSKNNKKGFFHTLYEVYPKAEMSKTKARNVKYIKNQWNNYQRNFDLPNTLHCCAEGINSHYFASRLSSRPRCF